MSQASSSTANAGFKSVRSLAGQLSNVSVSEARISKVVVNDLNVSNVSNGLFKKGIAVGYAPIGFSTATIGSLYPLNRTPNTAMATGVAGDPIPSENILQLPSKSVVTGWIITNNGVTVTSGGGNLSLISISMSPNVWPISLASNAYNISENSTVAGVNNGIYATTSALATEVSGTGVLIIPDISTVYAKVGNFNLTSGDLKIKLEYITPV